MSQSASLLRKVARAVTGGPRGYFNSHFGMLKQDVNSRLDTLGQALGDVRAAQAHQDSRAMVALEKYEEMVALLGTQVARLSDDLGHRLTALQASTDEQLSWIRHDVDVLRSRPVPESVTGLDPRQIELLNFNATHRGYAAQAGLWLNPALHVAYDADGPYLGGVNERVAEIPYVIRALAGLPADARVLDVGACESTLAFSLASLGYRVTPLDPRPYPLRHPNLTPAQTPIETFADPEGFDAVILLSTVEHIGVGAYSIAGHEDADLEAMASVRRLLRPGGIVVVTTPFGTADIDELERTYDADGIRSLLAGFELVDAEVIRSTSPTTWEHEPGGLDVAVDETPRVVMLTARVPASAS